MREDRNRAKIEFLDQAVKSAQYSKLFPTFFTPTFSVRFQNYYRTREASTSAQKRLERIYRKEATTLFMKADFTAVLTRLLKNRHAAVNSLIKDALQFPPNNIDAIRRMSEGGAKIYKTWESDESQDKLSADLMSSYAVFVNSAIEATEAVLTRVVDDNPGASIADVLSEDGLLQIITESQGRSCESKTFEELGQEMSRGIRPPTDKRGSSRSYWDAVKHEIFIFVCTDDKKYADLRRQLNTLGSTRSQTTIVSAIATAVTSSVGAIAGLAVPLCALALLAVVQIGKNAFCAQTPLEMRIKG